MEYCFLLTARTGPNRDSSVDSYQYTVRFYLLYYYQVDQKPEKVLPYQDTRQWHTTYNCSITLQYLRCLKSYLAEISIKENSDNLDNCIKTMILDSIDKLRGKKKCTGIDSIFDFLSKTVATNINKDTLVDSISQLITLKLLVNKKTPNGHYFLYLRNVDQREIELTPEIKSDKIR